MSCAAPSSWLRGQGLPGSQAAWEPACFPSPRRATAGRRPPAASAAGRRRRGASGPATEAGRRTGPASGWSPCHASRVRSAAAGAPVGRRTPRQHREFDLLPVMTACRCMITHGSALLAHNGEQRRCGHMAMRCLQRTHIRAAAHHGIEGDGHAQGGGVQLQPAAVEHLLEFPLIWCAAECEQGPNCLQGLPAAVQQKSKHAATALAAGRRAWPCSDSCLPPRPFVLHSSALPQPANAQRLLLRGCREPALCTERRGASVGLSGDSEASLTKRRTTAGAQGRLAGGGR